VESVRAFPGPWKSARASLSGTLPHIPRFPFQLFHESKSRLLLGDHSFNFSERYSAVGALFAAPGALLLIHNSKGHRRTVFMFGQRHRADAIADHLAVQGQGAGQNSGLRPQPFAQTSGKLIGIQPDQNLVKHIVTRYPVKASTARFTWKSQAARCLGCNWVAKRAIWAMSRAPARIAMATNVSTAPMRNCVFLARGQAHGATGQKARAPGAGSKAARHFGLPPPPAHRLGSNSTHTTAAALLPFIALYEKQIAELFDAHPDSFLFRDLPGAGSALAPRLLTAFGTDRGRFDNPTELLSLSGIASIRRASGKKTGRSS
jgi:Transposase IS116/IS110/IS902 family